MPNYKAELVVPDSGDTLVSSIVLSDEDEAHTQLVAQLEILKAFCDASGATGSVTETDEPERLRWQPSVGEWCFRHSNSLPPDDDDIDF